MALFCNEADVLFNIQSVHTSFPHSINELTPEISQGISRANRVNFIDSAYLMKHNSFSLKLALIGTLLVFNLPVMFAQTREQNNEAARLNNQALALGREGRGEEALELLNRSLSIDEDQIVLYNRSIAFYRLDRYDEAMKDINKVLLRNSMNAKGLAQRALIYSAQNNDVAAFDDLTQALTLEPDNIQFAVRRSRAALAANKYAQSLDSYYYAESIAQKQPEKAPNIVAMLEAVPGRIGSIYNILGLPTSSFMKGTHNPKLADPFSVNFTPKSDELRFDGVCSGVDKKTGVVSFDTLAVSFPNGKTKVLPQAKRRSAKSSGVKVQNRHSVNFSGQIKTGDFLVIVGKDNGKIIATRVIALAAAKKALASDEEISD